MAEIINNNIEELQPMKKPRKTEEEKKQKLKEAQKRYYEKNKDEYKSKYRTKYNILNEDEKKAYIEQIKLELVTKQKKKKNNI